MFQLRLSVPDIYPDNSVRCENKERDRALKEPQFSRRRPETQLLSSVVARSYAIKSGNAISEVLSCDLSAPGYMYVDTMDAVRKLPASREAQGLPLHSSTITSLKVARAQVGLAVFVRLLIARSCLRWGA
jgi:hypothetical protein